MIDRLVLELRAKKEGITLEELMDRIDKKINSNKSHEPLYCPASWA